jgi:hypothetical protein
MPKIGDIADPMCIQDTFAVDLVAVDEIGPNVRLTFTTPLRVSESRVLHNVVARLLVSRETLAQIRQRLGEPAFKITPHMLGEWEDRIHH